MGTYTKNGKTIAYQITKKNIKNTYFRLKDGCLHVTTNPTTSKAIILTYIDRKFDLFYDKITHLNYVESSQDIMLWGKHYQLHIHKGNFSYEMVGDMMYVRSRLDDLKKVKNQIYKAEIIQKVCSMESEIEHTIKQKGLTLLPIKYKYLKSKFGSYHRRHNEITLNTFLARLDPIYLNYVIYHEYAHVLVFNHSKDFYNLLAEFIPNHRLYQKDLKKIAII